MLWWAGVIYRMKVTNKVLIWERLRQRHQGLVIIANDVENTADQSLTTVKVHQRLQVVVIEVDQLIDTLLSLLTISSQPKIRKKKFLTLQEHLKQFKISNKWLHINKQPTLNTSNNSLKFHKHNNNKLTWVLTKLQLNSKLSLCTFLTYRSKCKSNLRMACLNSNTLTC